MCIEKEGRRNDKTCSCCPYRSPLLITSQVLSTLAFSISWIWWVTFVIGLPTMIVLQITWCCQMTKAGIISTAIMSTITTILSVFAGIWTITQWKGDTYCHVWVLTDDDQYNTDYYTNNNYSQPDYCNETAWGIVAFFQAGLWGTASIFMWIVLCSGKFDQMRREIDEEQTEPPEAVAGIELGDFSSNPAPGVAHAVMLPEEEANKYYTNQV